MEELIEKLKKIYDSDETINGRLLVEEAEKIGISPPALFKELHRHYSYLFEIIN